MSAIYQRARPVRWEDVVGQEHVKDVLKAALEQGRVGHAYLFSGPRGVGKTTTARLIAMTANCQSEGPKPCGECESCLSVRAGSHPDVLEIDAASNNSVDDVRELREKVSLAAMRGGKKIYILDEAHMMSKSAFNALLKTLEEPPEHVIFILATTEPEKIIPTILSRCQHYRFRRLTAEEIASKLAGLVQTEEASAEEEALHLIGRLADGAMRDGESLLERMLAAGKSITRQGVEEALGLPPNERVRGIAAALITGDMGAALAEAGKLYRDGFAARTIVEGLIDAFGHALHAELGLGGEKLEGAEVARLLRLQAELDEQEIRFVRSADQQSLELALTHALLAAESGNQQTTSTSSTPSPELVQRLNRLEKELATLKASGIRAAQSGTPAQASATSPVAEFNPTGRQAAPLRQAVQQAVESVGAAQEGNWADVVQQLNIQMKAFIKPARMHAQPGYVSLTFDQRNAFHAKNISNKFDELSQMVHQVFGPVTFELIAPDNLSRKTQLGKSTTKSKATHQTETNPTEQVGDGEETPPARRKDTSSLAVEPTASMPSSPAPVQPEIPDFEPVARPTREPASAVAIAEAPVATKTAKVQNASLSSSLTAPPPLTQHSTSMSEEEDMPFQTDSVPPLPPRPAEPEPIKSVEQGEALQDQKQSAERELYLGEVITEEPNWDDFGGPGTEEAGQKAVQDSLENAPYAEFAAKRPEPTETPSAPAPSPPPSEEQSLESVSKKPSDIRAHPMYDEVKHRFQGRVREIGKNRKPIPEAQTSENGVEEAEDET